MNIGVSTGKAGMFVTMRDGDKMVQIDPRDLLAADSAQDVLPTEAGGAKNAPQTTTAAAPSYLGRRARRIITATDAIPSERLNTSTHGLVGKSSPTRATHFFHFCSAITHDHP